MCAVALAVISGDAAYAQLEPDAPSSGQSSSEQNPDENNPSPTTDEAWQLYDRAFAQLMAGKAVAARQLLQEISGRFPDHPAAAQAARRVLEVDTHSDLPSRVRPERPTEQDGAVSDRSDESESIFRGSEPTSLQARAEFVFNMTGPGVLLGYGVREMLAGDGDRSLAAALMIGGGTSLGASLYFSRGGITQGQSQLYNSALYWGLWNSLLINDGPPESADEAGRTVAAQLGGLGVGALLSSSWTPSSGAVALANTGGLWATVVMLLFHGIADTEPEIETIVLAGDAGLLLGGLISRKYPMSRGRTLLIDTGGVLGILAGSLIVVAAETDGSAGSVFLLGGTVTGLGLAVAGTRNWDAPGPVANVRLGVSPMGARGWGATAAFEL